MELTLIRHSIPDYTKLSENDSTYLPTKAHLSEEGILLAENNFKNIDFSENEIILCSPFQRALDTSSVLTKFIDIPIFIEEDLHEWLPDKNFEYKIKDIKPLYKDYVSNNGIGIDTIWETDLEVKNRVYNVLNKYNNYEKVIIVAHSRLFKICFGLNKCDFASISKIHWERGF